MVSDEPWKLQSPEREYASLQLGFREGFIDDTQIKD
jgi:hypothetical protein